MFRTIVKIVVCSLDHDGKLVHNFNENPSRNLWEILIREPISATRSEKFTVFV